MERVKTVMEILDKMNFFQGQRAGRELWNDKPFEVQEEDLGNFKRDIDTIGSYIWEIVKELKQYRDAEEQGLLLRLPCKVGDVVYQITRDFISEFKIKTFVCDGKSFFFYWQCIKGIYVNIIGFHSSRIGKDVFLTKEEAEAALAKMKEV